MSGPALRERVQHALFRPQARGPGAAPLSVWAVLDLARDPRIHAALLASRLEHLCLYAGRVPRALEQVAPHIVELLPGHRLLAQLIDEGFGRSWGVYVRLEDPTALRHHLRKLLKVRDDEGRTMLFRFYDPRVLGPFLGTCDGPQLRELFGPVHSYLVEDAGGATLREFTLVGIGRLHEAVIPIAAD